MASLSAWNSVAWDRLLASRFLGSSKDTRASSLPPGSSWEPTLAAAHERADAIVRRHGVFHATHPYGHLPFSLTTSRRVRSPGPRGATGVWPRRTQGAASGSPLRRSQPATIGTPDAPGTAHRAPLVTRAACR